MSRRRVAARGLSVNNFDRHRKSSKNGGNATSLELAGGREERDTAGPGGSFYENIGVTTHTVAGTAPQFLLEGVTPVPERRMIDDFETGRQCKNITKFVSRVGIVRQR
jgi:hypothetical protein